MRQFGYKFYANRSMSLLSFLLLVTHFIIYTNILKGVPKPETVPRGALHKEVLLHVIHNNKKNLKLHNVRFDPRTSRTYTKVLTTRPNNN